jgi:hypothetical protein
MLGLQGFFNVVIEAINCPFAHFKQGKRIKALMNKGQSNYVDS